MFDALCKGLQIILRPGGVQLRKNRLKIALTGM